MTVWTIESDERGFYHIKELGEVGGHLIYRYPEGDIDRPSALDETRQHLHGALYDLYQCNDKLEEGDTFTLNGEIAFACISFHVLEVADERDLYRAKYQMARWQWRTARDSSLRCIQEASEPAPPGVIKFWCVTDVLEAVERTQQKLLKAVEARKAFYNYNKGVAEA
jgi:hypothetical protein